MQANTKAYTDIDYESFPIADLTLDRHWIQLPTAVLLDRQKARRAAQYQERLAALPEDHKIILVPADPTYSPLEEEDSVPPVPTPLGFRAYVPGLRRAGSGRAAPAPIPATEAALRLPPGRALSSAQSTVSVLD